MGKILGVTPLWTQNSNTLSKIYVLSLILVVTFGTVLSIRKRFVTLSDLNIRSSDEVFLEISECSFEMVFMLSCFLATVCRSAAWERFFRNFLKANEQLHHLGFTNHGNVGIFGVRFAVINLVFFAIHAYEIIVWEEVPESSIEDGYILYRISMYYQCFVVYVAFCITEMLKNRYEFLHKLIKDTLKTKRAVIIISSKNNKRALEKLAKIQKTYTILYNVVQDFNLIFGWTLFIYFSTFVANILVNLNVVLKYSQSRESDLNLKMLITYVIYSIVYIVSLLFYYHIFLFMDNAVLLILSCPPETRT